MDPIKQGGTAPPQGPQAEPTKLPQKKQWLWSVLFVAIALISVLAVVLQSKDFSLSQFIEFIKTASVPWLIAAFCSMLGFILFEGLALLVICRAFGYRKKLHNGFIYSASDIYFSAITPSATGGQPASAFFMIKDGIPGMVVTVALLLNLAMYTISIIAIGAICFLFHWDVFMQFDTVSTLLIIIGVVTQLGMALFFMLLIKKDLLLHRICRATITLLCKLHLLKRGPEKQLKLDRAMDNYRGYIHMLKDKRGLMLKVFLFNFLQRGAQIAVTMFTYLATGGDPSQAFSLWTMQGYVVLGSNTVPIPGAMGVSDYIMLNGFRSIMSESAAVNLELLSRSFSFYICILICGISTLVYYQLLKKRRKLKC